MRAATNLHLPFLLAAAAAAIASSFAPPPSIRPPLRSPTERAAEFRNFQSSGGPEERRRADERQDLRRWKGGKDHHATLGVSRNASSKEIKRAYRRMARRYHPDANCDDADTAEKFKDINSAYHALTDPARKKFDEFRGAATTKTTKKAKKPRPKSNHFRRRGFGRDVDLGDRKSNSSAQNRGAARGGSGNNVFRARRAAAASLGLEIDPTTAAEGGEREIELTRLETCRACNGKKTLTKQCDVCDGSGVVKTDFSGFEHMDRCDKCQGTGVVTEDCESCGGKGRTEETVRLGVVVPPGVRDGDVLRTNSPLGDDNIHVFLRAIGGPDSQHDDESDDDESDDIRIDLPIDPRTTTAMVTVRYGRFQTCGRCSGKGLQSAALCPACGGSGVVGFAERSLQVCQYDYTKEPEWCPECDGTGLQRDAETCGTCKGKGRVLIDAEVAVSVPPGVSDGDEVRVRGGGDAGRGEGDPVGDLRVRFRSEGGDGVRAEGETEDGHREELKEAASGVSERDEFVDPDV